MIPISIKANCDWFNTIPVNRADILCSGLSPPD